MYRVPFHRRILPWLYIVVFLAIAPLLIFYTAGYRYNPKKQQIERSGTLIVNTAPKGVRIFLDGRDTQEVSPVTFQNITPGWHQLRLEKTGYHPWERNLDIRAEQVTFVTDIWLWRQADPTFITNANIQTMRADPTGQRMAIVTQGATSSMLGLWSQDATLSSNGVLAGLSSTAPTLLDWRDDGQALTVVATDGTAKNWLVQNGQTQTNDVLPSAEYHWSQGELIGTSGTASFRIDPDRNTFVRDTLPTSTLSLDQALTVDTSSTSPTLLLRDHAFQTHVFALPPGDWRIAAIKQTYALLNDHDAWLALEPNTSHPVVSRVSGDYPRWLANAPIPRALFVHGYELWDWTLGSEPVLLWRQSEPIIQATWHPNGTTAFVATAHQVFAITTQASTDHAAVPLASFDHIQSMDLFGKNLMIAGTKGGKNGLWSLAIE